MEYNCNERGWLFSIARYILRSKSCLCLSVCLCLCRSLSLYISSSAVRSMDREVGMHAWSQLGGKRLSPITAALLCTQLPLPRWSTRPSFHSFYPYGHYIHLYFGPFIHCVLCGGSSAAFHWLSSFDLPVILYFLFSWCFIQLSIKQCVDPPPWEPENRQRNQCISTRNGTS